jgi:hypothetical protein
MTQLPRSPGSILVLRLNQETVHDFMSPMILEAGDPLVLAGVVLALMQPRPQQ